MSVAKTVYEHISINERNEAVIKGTTMKVIELVLDKIAYGWSPEELQYQHPCLSLGQIYSALAYYSDHQDAIDKEIESQLKEIDRIKKASKSSPLVKRLKVPGYEVHKTRKILKK